jgi:hypothetical protein
MLAAMRAVYWAALAVLASGCSAHPPPNWAQGGAPVDIPRARWDRGGRLIDIMPDGHVLLDGGLVFSIDRAGRVFEADNDSIAVLQPDGHLVGNDGNALGTIGIRNASPPGQNVAWLSIGDHGEVTHFDTDGDQHPDGLWNGCGPAVRTCTLVTHIVSMVEAHRRQAQGWGAGGFGPHVGIGIGFGMVFGP